MEHTQSILQFKETNCTNCYKCVRNCPVKAIRVRSQHAQIMTDLCILCEKCTLVCPQNAKAEQNQVPQIQGLFRTREKVIASVHPAWPAQYADMSFSDLRQALIQLGFSDAFEAAEGAALIKQEYENLLAGGQNSGPSVTGQSRPLVISSQCPVAALLVERYFPELVPSLAPIPSLMQVHAELLKRRFPDARIVYISPCIAPLGELSGEGDPVDYVITFAELTQWLRGRKIGPAGQSGAGADIRPADGGPADSEIHGATQNEPDIRLSRLSAIPGGLSLSMRQDAGYEAIIVHGMENCQHILEEVRQGGYDGYFLELNACSNGCIGGPSFQKQEPRLIRTVTVVKNLSMPDGKTPDYGLDFHPEPIVLPKRKSLREKTAEMEPVSESQIRVVLEQMGKYSKKDEYNCGACGYNTCREKAEAVCRGKAEITMCVPFMRARQESHSRKIIAAIPGLLMTVDYHLDIVSMNKAALDLFDITRKKDLIGKSVSDIMDDYALVNMISFDKKLVQDRVTLPDGRTCLDRVITNDRKNRLIVCMMKDITKEIEQKRQLRKAQAEAVNIADRLMAEQLHMVHRIAGMLGETAADTKVALEELKTTIRQEQEEEEE